MTAIGNSTGATIVEPPMRAFIVVLLVALLPGCRQQDRDPAPGLFESQGTIDWDPVATLAELAAQSDAVVLGTLVGVQDGYIFGSSLDDEFGSPEIELIIDIDDDEPMRLVWSYQPGYSLDEISDSFPIGARLVLYATRFEVADSDKESFHHVGDALHAHWRWTNPQGLLLEDPDTGNITVYDASVVFDDAPPAAADLGAWLVKSLAFENRALAGLCEDTMAEFAEDEPSPHSTDAEAIAAFVTETPILDGLEVMGGAISLRGNKVGSYQVIPRPGDTFAVESAAWCYPQH